MLKNPPDNAGDIRDPGLILGLGRSPGEDMATHFSILAWRFAWTVEPRGSKELDTTEQLRCSLWLFPIVMYRCERWNIKKAEQELMLSNCGAGEDSRESLGQQGDQSSQS